MLPPHVAKAKMATAAAAAHQPRCPRRGEGQAVTALTIVYAFTFRAGRDHENLHLGSRSGDRFTLFVPPGRRSRSRSPRVRLFCQDDLRITGPVPEEPGRRARQQHTAGLQYEIPKPFSEKVRSRPRHGEVAGHNAVGVSDHVGAAGSEDRPWLAEAAPHEHILEAMGPFPRASMAGPPFRSQVRLDQSGQLVVRNLRIAGVGRLRSARRGVHDEGEGTSRLEQVDTISATTSSWVQ